eukprot:1053309-Rhodomonas_salina.1
MVIRNRCSTELAHGATVRTVLSYGATGDSAAARGGREGRGEAQGRRGVASPYEPTLLLRDVRY